jgi:prepilin peptidase CpaA
VSAFVSSALIGASMALAMMAYSGRLYGHLAMIHTIGLEVMSVRNPVILAERAAERKPKALLLPYGIPIAVGSIVSFAWAGLLI